MEQPRRLLEARRNPWRFLAQFNGQAMNATESDSFNGQAIDATESDSRFRLVADSAPVLLWMSGPDKLCNFLNKTWLDFTGRSFEQEKGYGWSKGVHPEDLEGDQFLAGACFTGNQNGAIGGSYLPHLVQDALDALAATDNFTVRLTNFHFRLKEISLVPWPLFQLLDFNQ
jgi:PAS domain-containing protein